MRYSRETGLLWWIGFQTCSFERSIAIWLPSFLHILIFSIFSATTLSWLHLSWLWKFQSWQSRLFHRWNWCGKSRLFYQKGNLLKNDNNPSKYKKRPFSKQECKHTAPCRNDFEALFPKKCQICKPIANWYIKGVQYTLYRVPVSVSEWLLGSFAMILYLSNSTNIHKYWDGNAVYGDPAV